MIHGVPISEIIYSLFLDCFNLIVIAFLVMAVLGKIWSDAIRPIFAFFASIMLGYALTLVLPLWGVSNSSGYILCFVIVTLLYVIICLTKRIIVKPTYNKYDKIGKYINLLFSLSALFVTIYFSYNLYINMPSHLLTSTFVIFVTIFSYLIYKAELFVILPYPFIKDYSKFCFIMGLGIFLIQAGFWLYMLFHATITEPPGSFIPKGVIFAKNWSITWGFDRLALLINNNWLVK